MKRFSLRLGKDLHEKLRKESFDTGESINEIITKLIENKYKEDIEMKKELLKKIDKIIEKEYWGMGHMGTEVISFTLELTDEERETFYEIELEENYGYDLDGNNLTISYSEEIERDKNMKKFKVEITRNGKAWTEEIQAESVTNACYKALKPYAQKMGGKVVLGLQGMGVESPVVGSWPTQYKISYWATCLK